MSTANLDNLKGWIEILRAAKAERQIIDDKIAVARGRIEEALDLADAEAGTVDGVTVVTWKTVSSTRLDQTLVKALVPAELRAQCMMTSTSRRFELVGGE
jgi:hypothetical protein